MKQRSGNLKGIQLATKPYISSPSPGQVSPSIGQANSASHINQNANPLPISLTSNSICAGRRRSSDIRPMTSLPHDQVEVHNRFIIKPGCTEEEVFESNLRRIQPKYK
jgi:hypothetical protein